MPTNKHATILYLALDKYFRNPGKKYYINDLIKVCNDALFEFDDKKAGIQKRAIFDDMKLIESTQYPGLDYCP